MSEIIDELICASNESDFDLIFDKNKTNDSTDDKTAIKELVTTCPPTPEPSVNPDINSNQTSIPTPTQHSIRSIQLKSNSSIKCYKCDEVFNTLSELTQHLVKIHEISVKKTSLRIPVPSANPNSNSNQTSISVKTPNNPNPTQPPIQTIQSKPIKSNSNIKCFKCKEVFNTLSELTQHLHKVHEISGKPTPAQTPVPSVKPKPNLFLVIKPIVTTLTTVPESAVPAIAEQTSNRTNDKNSNPTSHPIESIQSKPITKSNIKCFKCKQVFESLSELTEHLDNIHKIGKYSDKSSPSQPSVPLVIPNNPINNLYVVSHRLVNRNERTLTQNAINKIKVSRSTRRVPNTKCNICGKNLFGTALDLLKHKELRHLDLLAKYECSFKCCSFKTIIADNWSKHQLNHEKREELVVNKRHNYSTKELNRIWGKITESSDSLQKFEFNGNLSEISDFRNGLDSLRTSVNQLICNLEEIELSVETNKLINSSNSELEMNGTDEPIEIELSSGSDDSSNEEIMATISEKLIKLDKKRAKYVCDWSGCQRTFERVNAMKAHKLNHQRHPFRCPRDGCEAAYTDEYYLRIHVNRHEGQYRCTREDCEHRARNERDLETHTKRHDMETPFECHSNGCNKRCKTVDELQQHQLVKHPNDYPDIEWLVCTEPDCDYRTKAEANLKIHTKTHTFSLTCSKCEERFPTRSELRLHQFQHSSAKEHKCTKCGKNYLTQKTLIEHLERKHSGKVFFCEVKGCHKRYGLRRDLWRHTRERHDKGMVECEWESCEQTFVTQSAMRDHMNSHTGARPYLCEVDGCGKAFTSRKNLLLHNLRHKRVRVQSGPKNYKCGQCGKTYYERTGLGTHMKRIHAKKEFLCDVDDCAKRFAYKPELKRHKLLVHDKHRPFQCEWDGCGQRFGTKVYLADHINRHTGNRPYLCPEPTCGKAFKTRCDLHSHKLQHKDRKFACVWPECEFKAISNSKLRAHYKDKHKSDPNIFKVLNVTKRGINRKSILENALNS